MAARRFAAVMVGLALLVTACSSAGTTDSTVPAATAATAAPTTAAPTTVAIATTAVPETSVATTVDPITGGIEGVMVYEGLSQQHATGDVEYTVRPPVGGMHAAEWLTCGAYDSEVVEEEAVHSLEHGAVWITYDASEAAEERLASIVSVVVETFPPGSPELDYVLVSPYPDMPSPVVASAWGVQLLLDTPGDPRLAAFLLHFTNGPQNPEPGAPC